MTQHRSPWTIFRSGLVIAAVAGFAMIAAGCATGRDHSQEVGSTEDYVEQGQREGYAYGYDRYYPYMIGYDPFWGRWYPAPIYYYSRSDNDRDCDDVNCGSRRGAHDADHKPSPSTGTGTTPPRNASHAMPLAGTPHVFSGPAVASGGSENVGGIGRGGDFGKGGFGGARGGSGRR